MVKPTLLFLQLLILVFPTCVSAQTKDSLADPQRGSETVKPYKLDDSGQILQIAPVAQGGRLLTKLPPGAMKHQPRLLGISDFDGDGTKEVFIGWSDRQLPGSGEFLHHFQIYRLSPGQTAIFTRELQIEGGPVSWIEFPIVPQGGKPNAAIANVMGGAKWGTYYVIFPGNKPVVKLGQASHLKLADLDGDGTCEWILLQWRGSELRCSYGFFGMGDSADIFRLSGGEFERIWPPSDWAVLDGEIEDEVRRLELEQKYGHPLPPSPPRISGAPGGMTPQKSVPWGKTCLVMNRFNDVDDDGRLEIVALSDVVTRDNPRFRLSIYKLSGNHFDSVAYFDAFPAQYPVALMGMRRLKDRKQFVLRLADARKCNDDMHRYDEGVMIAGGIDFKDGSLKLCWVNDKIDITLWGSVKDVDGDGEEEVIFSSEGVKQSLPQGPGQKKPLLLRGVKDFLSYTPPR